MTWIKALFEGYINLNLSLILALVVWIVLRSGIRQTRFAHAYGVKLFVLKVIFCVAVLSPVLALLATQVQEILAPGRTFVLSDMFVAAYLRGDVQMGALEFERFLNMRNGWTEGLFALSSPVFVLLAGALLLGLIWQGARFGRAILRARDMVQQSHVIRRMGTVEVRLCARVRVPVAVRGLFRHYVILPLDFNATGRDRQMAMAHEFQHFRNRDLEWEIGLEALRPLFFWNPAFVILKRELDRWRELSCDEAVLSRRGFEPYEYAMCLLRFCERAVQAGRGGARIVPSVGLVSQRPGSARRELARRLLTLGDMRGRPCVGIVPGFCFAAILSVGFALFAASIQTHEDWSQDRLTLSTVVNLERFAAINAGF